MKIRFHRSTSVVNYDYARDVLSDHYDLYRKNDTTLCLLARTDPGWHKPAADEKICQYLSVDQGVYSDVWDGTSLRYSRRAEELINFGDLLKGLSNVLTPEFVAEPSPYIGEGRSERHRIDQYWTSLLEGGYIEEISERVYEIADLLMHGMKFSFMWDNEVPGVRGWIQHDDQIREIPPTHTVSMMIKAMKFDLEKLRREK